MNHGLNHGWLRAYVALHCSSPTWCYDSAQVFPSLRFLFSTQSTVLDPIWSNDANVIHVASDAPMCDSPLPHSHGNELHLCWSHITSWNHGESWYESWYESWLVTVLLANALQQIWGSGGDPLVIRERIELGHPKGARRGGNSGRLVMLLTDSLMPSRS